MMKMAKELNTRTSVLVEGRWRKPVHVWIKGDKVALVFNNGSVELDATKMISTK
jgi:hypothetical protein